MNKENQLQLLGLSEKEAKLYLNALELGTFSVMGIANKSGLKRPTCYLILDELVKKGLVSMAPRVKKILYMVESPDALIRQAEEHVLMIKKLAPQLHEIYNTDKKQPTIKFYSGQKGIRNIYDDILLSNIKEYLYIGSGEELIEMAGKDFIDGWIRKRIEKNIKAFSIRMKKTEIHEKLYQETKSALREIRYAPNNIHIPDTVLIYGKKVAIISTRTGNFGFVMESDEFVTTMLGLFKSLWQLSSKK